MNNTGKKYLPRFVAVCAAAVMVLALASVAYATNLGGFRRTVQIWLRGEQVDVIMEAGDGQYTIYREDENGELQEIGGGGGVEIDRFGNERPLTGEELLEEYNSANPEVEYEEDGTVWLYYKDQKIELTDRFDADGFCYTTLNDGDDVMYLTIKYQKGWAIDYGGFNTPKSAFSD